MKDKIIMLIVGIILGAVLAGGCFWFATSITKNERVDMQNMDKGMMREDKDFNPNSNIVKSQNTTDSNS